MSRLLFASARGARIQLFNKWSGKWDTDSLISLTATEAIHRIHPDDEHLQYGPVSTALRDLAKQGVVMEVTTDWELVARYYFTDIAWEKVYKNLYDQLSVEEIEAYDKGNPKVQSAYTPYKPIGVGNKADGKKYNDIMLDKFALFPISYRIMKEFNKEADVNYVKLYDRMQSSGVDYVVFASGRKVGSNVKHKLYDDNGAFVTDSFGTVEDGGISIIPLTILSNQTDVPTKETSTVTTGSQAVKLMTLDLMEGGVPVDFMRDSDFTTRYQEWVNMSEDERLEASKLYKEIKNNQKIVEALIKNGMDDTMTILGITKEVSVSYVIISTSFFLVGLVYLIPNLIKRCVQISRSSS